MEFVFFLFFCAYFHIIPPDGTARYFLLLLLRLSSLLFLSFNVPWRIFLETYIDVPIKLSTWPFHSRFPEKANSIIYIPSARKERVALMNNKAKRYFKIQPERKLDRYGTQCVKHFKTTSLLLLKLFKL
jgi:hypothetical protein